jgi:putative restriction endonuclease
MSYTTYTKLLEDGTIIGNVGDIKEGSFFIDRQELHDKGLHRGLMRGIAPKGSSVVLSGGYPDDKDEVDTIIYTGEGGRDPNTNKQIQDQEFTGGNKALAENHLQGIPVRVIRGEKYAKNIPPGYRYRYDGLYQVAATWDEIGRDGYKIYRYRLEKIKSDDIVSIDDHFDNSTAPVGSNAPGSKSYRVTRKIRSTDLSDYVKKLYDYKCQVCSTRLETPKGLYAEGCHIKALGKPHEGPDKIENILCLCPNCHVLFDEMAFCIEDNYTLIGSKTGKLNVNSNHNLSLECIRYHRSLRL